MTKAPDAFRTISEVAAELDLPQHVLRFWESRFPQIKPMKRGGGRRYYRPDDVELLRGIRHLLYGQGYTIRGVQRILREQGPRFVQSVWQEGAPQPEPAAEPDVGEAEVADAEAFAAELPTAGEAEAEGALPPEADLPLPMEATRREPTFAPIVPHESADAVAAPIQPQVEAEAGNGHDRPAMPEPKRAAGLPDVDRERLAAALQELAECRRLLDDALADVEPEA
ncbi:MAG: MerR family transcriptional regulator [Xanthobacteraceae bacterium]